MKGQAFDCIEYSRHRRKLDTRSRHRLFDRQRNGFSGGLHADS